MGHLRLFLFYHFDVGAVLGLLEVKWFGSTFPNVHALYPSELEIADLGVDGGLDDRCILRHGTVLIVHVDFVGVRILGWSRRGSHSKGSGHPHSDAPCIIWLSNASSDFFHGSMSWRMCSLSIETRRLNWISIKS